MCIIAGPHSLSAAVLSRTSVHLTWVAPCDTQQYPHIYYRGTCGTYNNINESRLATDYQEYTVNGLQEDINYSFTVNQSGFSGGRVLSTGSVFARTFTAGTEDDNCTRLDIISALFACSVPSEAPLSLEAVWFVQPTEVFLRWGEVPCIHQNGPITAYVVRYYATCGADRDVRNKAEVTHSTRIEGLTPNTEYAFQVAAVNVNGTGTFSEPITLRGKI